MYDARLDANLAALSAALRDGHVSSAADSTALDSETGPRERRPLGIPTVRDRVVQTALRLVLEPIFDAGLCRRTATAFGRAAARRTRCAASATLLQAGYTLRRRCGPPGLLRHASRTAPLRARVQTKVSDGRVLALVDAFLQQPIFEGLAQWTARRGHAARRGHQPAARQSLSRPARPDDGRGGLRDGALCRRLRHPVPHRRGRAAGADARAALDRRGGLTAASHRRRVWWTCTQPGGFDFLGYHFERDRRWPRQKSLQKLKDAVRQKTRRTNGHSLTVIIADVNRTLRGLV